MYIDVVIWDPFTQCTSLSLVPATALRRRGAQECKLELRVTFYDCVTDTVVQGLLNQFK
jgi:hypothetical protein